MLTLYRSFSSNLDQEECFYVETSEALTTEQYHLLYWLISEGRALVQAEYSMRALHEMIEIGPRLSVETPFSSNAVAICRSVGLPVVRLEKSTRYRVGLGLSVSSQMNADEIVRRHLDPMTQTVYERPLVTFDSGTMPESVRIIPILERGEAALREENARLGLGMDEWDIRHWTAVFLQLGRNATDVELTQIGNGNSEHSRHWFFRCMQVIDGMEMPESLMDIVREPLRRKNDSNSLVAFHDNAGVIRGCAVNIFLPENPGEASAFGVKRLLQHITATAETHNHPTLISPFPGAETGSGGRIRDNRAVGRGGLVHAGLAGYCVGNLHIPGYPIPGQHIGGEELRRSASPLRILIEGSNGISDYGNKIGEPLILGFCRSFGQMVDGKRREFRKPVLYSAGLGRVLDEHVAKHPPEMGMLIVRTGGPAYRIGVGGGSASSMIHGSQGEDLDWASVQRGDAEYENRDNRVFQACAELGADNPIESIHDQGAGGPSNVLTELMEPLGGRVDIRKITVGDRTMSVLELWVAEYQEGYGVLVRHENIERFKTICRRERVNCEVLGEVTGDGRVVVVDSASTSGDQRMTTPVDLPLKEILGDLPRKRFESSRKQIIREPLIIPPDLTIDDALRMIFRLPSVGSKGFLVRKVDRSVTGLVVRQQCCGPMQVPVADCAVTADGYFGQTGAATALGEQPIKMLLNPKVGARMAVAEMLTNLASVKITSLSDVMCRANWMWAAKLPGEGALLYDAAVAMRDIMLELGIAIDGGKDSLSTATQVGDQLVVSPGVLVIMGYAPVPDITKVVTPDFKSGTFLSYIDLGQGKCRLGGSALAQALGQLGDESPDIDDVDLLRRAFEAMQELIGKGLVCAYHDISDGGLITAVVEMCIAGNCGARIDFASNEKEPFATLFGEEAGVVFQFGVEHADDVVAVLEAHNVPRCDLGIVSAEYRDLTIAFGNERVLKVELATLRQWWEATSTELEKLQADPATVEAESKSHASERVPKYRLSFEPKAPNLAVDRAPKVAVIREEGVNGDREMAAALYTAEFEPWDIAMSDLVGGRITSLEQFRGAVFPGGFSYADVLGSAKGWAAAIRFNPRLSEMFDRFYDREDTFSLGVCNGCQLMANIGWLPYRGLPDSSQPRFVHNASGRFESRFASVAILPSPSIMLRGMEGSILGVWVAHGEGRMLFPDSALKEEIWKRQLVPLVYVDPDGEATGRYPFNPNGSPEGWTALTSPCGRHLAMMPHPERCFLKWQWPWMPEEFRKLEASPWLQMFQNAREWCLEH